MEKAFLMTIDSIKIAVFLIMQNEFDIIVIGGGATGLMAALELALTGKKVAIIEAKDRIGGRIHSLSKQDSEAPIELGAEFVHGDLELTQLLLKKAGAKTYKLNGDIWRKEGNKLHNSDFVEDYSLLNKKLKELQHDISVQQFFEQYLNEEKHNDLRKSLKNYVEGYYAADLSLASTFALREELQNSSDRQYRIEGGYQTLLNYFNKVLLDKGCSIFLSSPVKQIRWSNNKVAIEAARNTYIGRKCVVTVSLGVLRSEGLLFSPALPDKIDAAKALGFGPVIKIVLHWKSTFWKEKSFTQGKDLSSMGFLFSEEDVPTWWTTYPKEDPMLTGWLGGPNAERLKDAKEEELIERSLQSLSTIFGVTISFLRENLISQYMFNWTKDPYTLGAYSFDTLNSKEHKQILKQPVGNTIFFAGEGLHEGPEIGTVEAALISGRETAHQVIAAF